MAGKEFGRWLTESVRRAFKTRRIVILSGARQTGKTTLCRQIAGAGDILRTLDDTALLNAALTDPKGFVAHSAKTMFIDEIQKAPLLLPEIKQVVDKNNRTGQYLLTGSANIRTHPGVTESLAGRVTTIRLRPFTQGEMLEKKPTFLKRAFSSDFAQKIKGFDKEAIVSLAFRGGYPEAARLKTVRARKEWHKDYIESLLTRDLKDIANVRRQDSLKELIGVLASWSGKFMELNSICAALSVSKITLESYINALVSLFVFEKLPPWHRSDYDRIAKRQKIYATDSGLMASALGWEQKEVMLNADRCGKLVETFVFHELSAHIDVENNCTLFHYRDREMREIDFIVQKETGPMLGVEVKAGAAVSKSDFKHIEWFKKNLAGKNKFTGIVLYSGEDTLSFGKGMLAVPIAALWNE
jgi:predicted AAA+ superfamily ATPase